MRGAEQGEVESDPTLDEIIRKGFSKEMPSELKLKGHGGATVREQQVPFPEVG